MRFEGNVPCTAPGEPLPCLQQTVFSGSACQALTDKAKPRGQHKLLAVSRILYLVSVRKVS